MKIVEIITFLGGGGAERFVVDLSNQLSIDNEIFLVTILDDKIDPKVRNYFKSELSSKVKYINLGLPNGLRLSSQWKVYSAIKKIKPDVIHVHMVPTLKYSALAIAFFSLSKKVYFSVHSDLHNGYDKGLFKLYSKILGKLGLFKLSCLSKKNYLDFINYYPHVKIRCIPNGRAPIVATQQFKSVQKEISEIRASVSSRLLIHVARCHPVKNQKLLIEVVNELTQEGYNLDLLIIGNGYDTPEGLLLQSIACDRIHFIGSRKNVSDYILNADIFCLSSYYEGMPITLLEACIAGVPAVSTPVCGAVDLIKCEINGLISKSYSKADYKKTLVKAINNYDLLKKNAMNMKDDSSYTIAECAKKYIEYFKE